ncbi:MAG TPA: LysR family transcriptional regulator [Ktedonobacterales bacterium]|nr:LysR family transcriptional regulator [Ktedonobacterales bacterium]
MMFIERTLSLLGGRIENLTVHQLRVFCTVAQHLSYTRAAEALGRTQPTVSAIIAQLERLTRLVLFEQHGKRLLLTDEGRELYIHAQLVVEAADDLAAAAAEQQGAASARAASLAVAGDTTVGTYVLPRLLGAFHQRHPDITLNFQVANREGVRARLLEHQADLVIAGRPPQVEGLVVEPFRENRLVAVASPAHPLATRAGPIPLAELAAERFFLREEGSGTRAAIEEVFEVAGVPLKISLVLGHLESIKQAVIANLGVSILAEAAIQQELGEGSLVVLPVAGLPIHRQWYITYLAPAARHPSAVALIEFLRAERDTV